MAIAADLGPGLAPAAFAPGRYATAIPRSLAGTHELQLVREASTASLALELDADGAARACRGWRYLLTNDGPDPGMDASGPITLTAVVTAVADDAWATPF